MRPNGSFRDHVDPSERVPPRPELIKETPPWVQMMLSADWISTIGMIGFGIWLTGIIFGWWGA